MAANYSIEQLLGWVPLTEAVETIAGGVPDPLAAYPQFEAPSEDVDGDSATYMQVTATRAVPKLVQYGAPPVRRNLRPMASQAIKLLSVSEEQPVDPMTMARLRSLNSYERDKGYKEVMANVERFAELFGNFRTAIKLLVLANGRLGFDASGNLLPDSSYGAAVEAIDFLVPANNKNQLNGIISAPWNLLDTDIPLQIRNLQVQAGKDSGRKLRYALYGVNVPSYISQNNFCVDYMARDGRMREEVLRSNAIPDGFCDLTWIPMAEAFWDTDDTGSSHQSIWDGDLVVFTPEPNEQGLRRWWMKAQGLTVVPTSLNITTDAMRALDNTKNVYGRFGYGILNPFGTGVSVKTIMGDVILYYLKAQNAIYQADTVF